jgi:GxxExxY protein
MNKEKIIYPELSYKLVGLFYKIHNDLGRYSREKQYSNAIEKIFRISNINYEREKRIDNFGNIVDFVIEDKILIEVKAKPFITREDYYQVKRYLISSKLKLGLLVNFRNRYLKPNRVLNINNS